MVGISGEFEELDDSEDFEELEDSVELVLIETCSGCCFSSSLGDDSFVALNGECG